MTKFLKKYLVERYFSDFKKSNDLNKILDHTDVLMEVLELCVSGT